MRAYYVWFLFSRFNKLLAECYPGNKKAFLPAKTLKSEDKLL